MTLDSETKIGTVGVTDYAQKALGDVVFVELPAEGAEMEKGGQYCLIEGVLCCVSTDSFDRVDRHCRVGQGRQRHLRARIRHRHGHQREAHGPARSHQQGSSGRRSVLLALM